MNRGIYPGVTQDGWRSYRPRWRCASNGAAVDPILGNPTGLSGIYNIGRYIIDKHGWVSAEVQMALAANSTVGSGDAYVFGLPVPAVRLTGNKTICSVPQGNGYVYMPFLTNWQMPIVAQLANPFTSLGGNENSYVQCVVPYSLYTGGFTVATSALSTVVAHNLGYTPNAADFNLTITETPGANNQHLPDAFRIESITSTTFTAVTRAALSTSFAIAARWKVQAESPTANGTLIGPTVPWPWVADTFHWLFLRLGYQSQ